MVSKRFFCYILSFGLMLGVSQANAANLKPFNLASNDAGDVAGKVAETKQKLTAAGFQVVGEYSPYDAATIVVVTNEVLKSNAAASDNGGFGAAVRVSVTKAGEQVQVSYSNPEYMAFSYRLSGKLSAVAASLKAALGHVESYGSEDGIEDEELEDWHYMFGMPYFNEPEEIASSGHQQALDKIEAGLAAKKGGVSKVFRIDIPGKPEVLFGVTITQGDGADVAVMQAIDKSGLKHSAHLPYGMLVSDGKVFVLQGEYRIASSFPDLSLGQFMTISSAPKSIINALKEVAE